MEPPPWAAAGNVSYRKATMAKGKSTTRTSGGVVESAGDVNLRKQAEEVLLKAGALQRAIFNLSLIHI